MTYSPNLNVGLTVGPKGLVCATGRYEYLGPPVQITTNAVGNISLACAPGTYAVSGSPLNFGSLNYVGVNALDDLYYYSASQPFLNLIKQSGSNVPYTNWWTSTSSIQDTGEEAYLVGVLDSNGYPTTLTVAGIPGGQKFTYVQTYMNYNIPANTPIPGAPNSGTALFPSAYQTITYQYQFQGKCTINLPNATSITTSSAGVTISGTQITSTNAWPTVNTVHFQIGNNPIQLQLLATGDGSGSNYYRSDSIVDSTYATNYAAGQILHPLFIASITNNSGKGFSRIRTMQGQATNYQDFNLTFSSASLTTSGTLTNVFSGPDGYNQPTWPLPSGNYSVLFSSGDIKSVSFTYGSSSCSWSGALSGALSSVGCMAGAASYNWSQRSLPGNMTWGNQSNGGPPYEVIFTACNQLGMDAWVNIPATAGAIDSTYAAGVASIAHNGTGASLGSNITSFSGFTNTLFVEYGNEISGSWSGGSASGGAFLQMASVPSGIYAAQGNNPYSSSAEQYGIYSAGIGQAFYAAYGSQYGLGAGQRCGVGQMTQFSNGSGPYFLGLSMNTPNWGSGAAYNVGHITHWGFAPYGGPNGGDTAYNSADWANITAQSDPVGELISIAYTNKGTSGYTYSAYTKGWCGEVLTGTDNNSTQLLIAGMAGQPWASLPIHCYESGFYLTYGSPASTSVLLAASRDSRIAYVYYDPDNKLGISQPGYLQTLQNLGVASINHFAFITEGGFDLMETVTQTTTPLASAPPRWAACINFANAGTEGNF